MNSCSYESVILPESMLEQVVARRLELPLTFQVCKAHPNMQSLNSTITHCGAHDFNAPPGICYAPRLVSNLRESTLSLLAL